MDDLLKLQELSLVSKVATGAWVGGCAQAPHACEQVGRAVVGSGRRAGRPLMCVPVPLTSALLLLLLLLDRRWRSCGRR